MESTRISQYFDQREYDVDKQRCCAKSSCVHCGSGSTARDIYPRGIHLRYVCIICFERNKTYPTNCAVCGVDSELCFAYHAKSVHKDIPELYAWALVKVTDYEKENEELIKELKLKRFARWQKRKESKRIKREGLTAVPDLANGGATAGGVTSSEHASQPSSVELTDRIKPQDTATNSRSAEHQVLQSAAAVPQQGPSTSALLPPPAYLPLDGPDFVRLSLLPPESVRLSIQKQPAAALALWRSITSAFQLTSWSAEFRSELARTAGLSLSLPPPGPPTTQPMKSDSVPSTSAAAARQGADQPGSSGQLIIPNATAQQIPLQSATAVDPAGAAVRLESGAGIPTMPPPLASTAAIGGGEASQQLMYAPNVAPAPMVLHVHTVVHLTPPALALQPTLLQPTVQQRTWMEPS